MWKTEEFTLQTISTPRRVTFRQHPKPHMQGFKDLLALPGEIRNQIYALLINSALHTPRGLLKQSPTRNLPISTAFTIIAFPRWHGAPLVQFNGIGYLPVLFVNKQIYNEVSTLLYWQAESLTLGGYTLQYRDENPGGRWRAMFSALERRPGLLTSVREVTIKLPSTREDQLSGHLQSLGLSTSSTKFSRTMSANVWAGVPDMLEFISKCQPLPQVRLLITIEDREQLDFTMFRGFCEVLSHRLTVNFTLEGSSRWTCALLAGKWNMAWNDFVAAKEKEDIEAAIEMSIG